MDVARRDALRNKVESVVCRGGIGVIIKKHGLEAARDLSNEELGVEIAQNRRVHCREDGSGNGGTKPWLVGLGSGGGKTAVFVELPKRGRTGISAEEPDETAKERKSGREAGGRLWGDLAELALEEAGATNTTHREQPLNDGQLENAREIGAGVGGVFDEAAPAMVDDLDESTDGDEEERVADLQLGILTLRQALDGKRGVDGTQGAGPLLFLAERVQNGSESSCAPSLAWRAAQNTNDETSGDQVEIMADAFCVQCVVLVIVGNNVDGNDSKEDAKNTIQSVNKI